MNVQNYEWHELKGGSPLYTDIENKKLRKLITKHF